MIIISFLKSVHYWLMDKVEYATIISLCSQVCMTKLYTHDVTIIWKTSQNMPVN